MISDRETALSLLNAAQEKNPGPWRDHSIVTSQVAYRIASAIPDVDPDRCQMAGLLHDIGRIRGISGVRHTIDGYDYLMEQGDSGLARYCITHAFPGKQMIPHTRWDFLPGQLDFVRGYLNGIEYDLTDKILQIADFMSTAHGPMVLEVRLMESALRNSVNRKFLDFWRECLQLKTEIDQALGMSVYDLFEDLLIDWPNQG